MNEFSNTRIETRLSINAITHCYRVHQCSETVKSNKVYDHTCTGMTAILNYRRKTAGKDERYVRRKSNINMNVFTATPSLM
jgi:hypothetical protein